MTESEWLECTDPTPMLQFLHGKASDRKVRLFACACCRQIWHLLVNERSRNAVEIAERFADGLASMGDLNEGVRTSWDLKQELEHLDDDVAYCAVSAAAEVCSGPSNDDEPYLDRAIEIVSWVRDSGGFDCPPYACELVRDIFGDPFRPVALDPVWLTPTVLDLAQAAYEERSLPSGELDPERLAVLSDAVEELGCDDEDILEHLRSPGPHVRGCWAVDLILGKS